MLKYLNIKEQALYTLVITNVICGGICILPLYFVIDSIPAFNLLVCFFNLTYLFICSKNKGSIRLPLFIKFYVAVIVYQLFTGWFTYSATVVAVQTSFLLVLISVYNRERDLTYNKLTSAYVFYALVNVVCTIAAFVLVTTGRISITSNPLDLNTFTKSDDIAFFPGYLTVFRPKDVVRVAFLPIEGMLCGFSHEPHVAGYLCVPAMFLLVNRFNKIIRRVLITLFITFIILTASTTTLISVPFVLFVGLLFGRKHITESRLKIVGILLCLLLVMVYFSNIIIDNFSFFIDKAQDNSADSSMAASTGFLSYALNPSSFFGTNIYSMAKDGDIGIITAVLNVSFYVSAIIFTIKMLKSTKREVFWTGMAFLYFLCHSMKGIIHTYQYPFAMLIMFSAYIVYKDSTKYVADKQN